MSQQRESDVAGKKRPTKQERDWFLDKLNEWRGRLFLHAWEIDATFRQDNKEGCDGVLAEVTVDPVYMLANIVVYKDFWDRSEERREKAIIHELCHCHTENMWNIARSLRNGVMYSECHIHDELEHLTQMFANCVMYGRK